MDTKKIINIRSLTLPSITRERERGPALQQEQQAQQESESNEVRVTLLVDEDKGHPWGIFLRGNLPGSRAQVRASVRQLVP